MWWRLGGREELTADFASVENKLISGRPGQLLTMATSIRWMCEKQERIRGRAEAAGRTNGWRAEAGRRTCRDLREREEDGATADGRRAAGVRPEGHRWSTGVTPSRSFFSLGRLASNRGSYKGAERLRKWADPTPSQD
jgi:hypothetical protein